jgi:Skp family chaperone for outer membrane proteins
MTGEGSLVEHKPKVVVSQGGQVLKSSISKSLLVAFTAAVLTFSNVAIDQVAAQEGSGPGLVAVLDVAKVFKDNAVFDSKMKAIKSEADQLRTQITQQQEGIKGEAQQLTQYEVGSAERNNMEGQLEQKQTALRTKARQAEADLLNREARIYYDTYEQLKSVVGEIAAQNNISLVLRFDSEEVDPTNRAEVIKGVNRSVVFHRRVDLTGMVSKAMNARSAQAPTGTTNR